MRVKSLFFVQVFTVLGNEVIGSVPYALANSARKEEIFLHYKSSYDK